MGRLLDFEVENARHAVGAGLTLFLLLAGHTILEVARDALFLSQLPADQLPWTYLAIALAAWLAAQADQHLATRFDGRRLAAATLLLASAGTAGFYALFGSEAWWVPHAFYVWTGLVATFAVAQFWRLLADIFTVAEAKQLYSRIAAGGSLGAVGGASVATFAQEWMGPRELLLFGGALLALTSFVPLLVFPKIPPPKPRARRSKDAATADRSDPQIAYVQRLLGLVALTAVTAVLVDYILKATIDAELAPEQLGEFFGAYYVVLNVVSLVVQLFLAPRLLTSLGATRSLAVLPVLFALGAVGVLITGGLVAAMALRGADGALRHSLHRSAFELLYLPLQKTVRDRYKTLIDAIGQRGGQAAGSLAILGVTMLGVSARELSIAVLGFSVAWVAIALTLRRRYLDLFRANLRRGSVETRVEVPELDLGSLESLMASLNSHRDEEVLATLDVLVDYRRANLIPALLLYHPSRAVVLRTLEIFADGPRTDYLPVARRLLEEDDDEVQAAAMHALSSLLGPDELRAELDHGHHAPMRAAVLVALVSRGLDEDGSALEELTRCTDMSEPTQLALTRAVRLQRDAELGPVLERMWDDPAPELKRSLALAFGALGYEPAIGRLIEWTGPRGARAEARDALVAIGEPAFVALRDALEAQELPRQIRGHVPRTISRFGTERAAEVLFAHLPNEPDGWIRYKCLRGLRALREALPDLSFDAGQMATLYEKNLRRAIRALALRLEVERGLSTRAESRGGDLLLGVLREKEWQAIDRCVRLIALYHPNEDLRRITHALRHSDRRRRAEGRELVTALVEPSLAPALDALLGDGDDTGRLARARAALPVDAPPASYEDLLAELMLDHSEAVRCIAAYHAAEIGMSGVAEQLEQARDGSEGAFREVVERALEVLSEIASQRGERFVGT